MEDERRKPPRIGVALAIVFGVLLLYVLSIGPAYRLGSTGRLSQSSFAVIYAPIIWISEHSDAARDALGWYCELWYLENSFFVPYGQPPP
jgi:hypothetical protein